MVFLGFDSGHTFLRQSSERFLPNFTHFLRERGPRILRSILESGTDYWKAHSVEQGLLPLARHRKWYGLLEGCASALKVVRTTERSKIRGAAVRTCRVTSDSWRALLPVLRSQPVFLWVTHVVALSVSRLCSQPVCRF